MPAPPSTLHRCRAETVRVAAVDLGTNSTRLLVADVERRARGGRPPARDHAARRGRRRASPPPPRPDRARPQRASPTTAASSRRSAPSARSASPRAPSATPRTARRSSARSSGATASRRGCSPATRRRELTLRGIGAGSSPDTLVVDIGGGSTELQVVRHRASATSLDVGCVRMTERFGDGRRARCERTCAALLPPGASARARDRRRRHGDDARRARPRARRVRPRADPRPRDLAPRRGASRAARLAALPLAERGADRRAGRAPVIVAGVVILARDARLLRPRRDRGERARHPPRRRARGGRAARARGGRGAARRLHLLLGALG